WGRPSPALKVRRFEAGVCLPGDELTDRERLENKVGVDCGGIARHPELTVRGLIDSPWPDERNGSLSPSALDANLTAMQLQRARPEGFDLTVGEHHRSVDPAT